LPTLGEKIRRMRTGRNLTLVQLGNMTHVSSVTIHNIERDIHVPKITTLIELSKALQTPLKHFIDYGPDGLFLRKRDGVFNRRLSGSMKSLELPQPERIELEAGQQFEIEHNPGRMVVLHVIFGRLEVTSGKRSIPLIAGDDLYAELFEKTILTAKDVSLGVIFYCTHPARHVQGSD